MGKASRWFRTLLGLKTTDKPPTKKKWTRAISHKDISAADEDNEASKRAIAVATATAAVAEAAVAAAQAAAAVVQLTSSGRKARTGCDGQSALGFRREDWAVFTIQSHFRGYLARRALRALKALVKLQALVRGHLVRKQTAYALRRLQALVRAQVRARAGRALNSESPQSSIKSSHFNYSGPATPEKFEDAIRARSVKQGQLMMLKRNGSKSSSSVDINPEKSQARRMLVHDNNRMSSRMSEQASFPRTHPTEDERSDKILEVDTGNHYPIPKHRTLFYSSHIGLNSDHTILSSSSCEVQSSPLKFQEHEDESAVSAYNSPAYYSVSSRRRAFTPTKSDGSRSCLSGYSDHPNYMSNTKSSKAKVRRSLSAPKQRSPLERSSSAKRSSVHGYGDSRSTQFANKAYPGSGRLDGLGRPAGGEITGFSGHC